MICTYIHTLCPDILFNFVVARVWECICISLYFLGLGLQERETKIYFVNVYQDVEGIRINLNFFLLTAWFTVVIALNNRIRLQSTLFLCC